MTSSFASRVVPEEGTLAILQSPNEVALKIDKNSIESQSGYV
jgi:hypothetical protein